MTETFRDFELTGWSDSNTCAEYHKAFGSITIQSVPALLDAAHVREGSHVLDVCCGAGYAAGLAAERGASAIGIDFAQSQIDLARKTYPKPEFEQGDATATRFGDQTFDCVVNSIGMPHFEDPDAAIAEACRVLKSGGRFAFSVYADPTKAVGFGIVYGAIVKHGSMDIGLPPGPNFFLFSDPQECEDRLSKVRFVDVETKTVQQTWRVTSANELLGAILEGSVRAAATLRGQTKAAQAKIRESIDESLSDFKNGNRYELPMPAIVVSAYRS